MRCFTALSLRSNVVPRCRRIPYAVGVVMDKGNRPSVCAPSLFLCTMHYRKLVTTSSFKVWAWACCIPTKNTNGVPFFPSAKNFRSNVYLDQFSSLHHPQPSINLLRAWTTIRPRAWGGFLTPKIWRQLFFVHLRTRHGHNTKTD